MSSPEPFRLTLQGPGVEVDQQIDRAAALVILRVALGETGAGPVEEAASKGSPRLSPREYIDGTGARSNAERITAFGVYLRDHKGQEDFSRGDIKASFRSAGEALPANFPRDFASAIQNGWIAEDHVKPNRYYVTRKGDEIGKRKGQDD